MNIQQLRILGLTILALPSFLGAQDHLFTVERYLDLERVASPQVSPDGNRIVYTRSYVDQMKDTWASMLWLMQDDGTRQRQLVKGSDPRWSPDGTRIAYLADADGKTQLWIRYMDAEGSVIQVTHGAQSPEAFRWAPDGKQLAFTMLVPGESMWSVPMPAPPKGAAWTASPKVENLLHYRADQRGFLAAGWLHLFVVQAEGGTPRQVTQGAFNVGARAAIIPGTVGFDWLADGKTIVFDGNDSPNAEREWQVSSLYVVDVATGKQRRLTTDKGYWTAPVVSPDGKWIAYTGFAATENSYKAEELYVMHSDGSMNRQISGTFDRDPVSLSWASDNETLWFTAEDRGSVNIYTASIAPKSPGVKPASNGMQVLALGSISSKGNFGVAVRSAPQQPQEIVRFGLKKAWDFTPLTSVNSDLLANLRLGETEELEFRTGEGTVLQGWVVKPPGFDPTKKYPLVFEIHGGPHAMYNVAFSPSFQNFAAAGNLVLFMNPRGSTGYGTEYGNAIAKAYPGVDYDDLMAGVNETISRGWVDTTRMYVGGCSGGGVLSSWIIGHTNRFAAAAVRCPVTNWLSFFGQTDVPLFVNQWFAKPFWEDPAAWLKVSPLMYVGNVKTPTLLMTGELDLRTPMPQSEEFFAALKLRGVPTTLLRFEGEYHGTGSKPSNWMRTQLYMMDWYSKYSAK